MVCNEVVRFPLIMPCQDLCTLCPECFSPQPEKLTLPGGTVLTCPCCVRAGRRIGTPVHIGQEVREVGRFTSNDFAKLQGHWEAEKEGRKVRDRPVCHSISRLMTRV